MSVPEQTNPFNTQIANGVTTVFPYTYLVLDADDLTLIIDGEVQISGYTVSGVGDPDGGNITITPAPANGAIVASYLNPKIKRETDYQQYGDWTADVVNADFDKIWLALQAVARDTRNSLHVTPEDIANGVNPQLPSPVAGSTFVWAVGGKSLVNVPLATGTSLVDLAASSGSSLIGFTQGGAGAATITVQDALRETVTPMRFGAKGDHKMAYVNITMAAASTTLTVNTGIFTSADVGKYIFVPRCGANGNALVTTIAAYVSATQVTLTAPSVKAVTAMSNALRWGSNDGPALQAMFDYCFNTGASWHIPPGPSGVYLTAQALNVRQCQNTFTNGRNARPPSWTMDDGATIKACAPMSYVMRLGDESSDYSQFIREGVFSGGITDCSFIADIGLDVPFGEVVTVQNHQSKNIKLKGIRFGSLTAPGASGGNQANLCSSSRDVDYVTVTAITKANPAVVTAPDHNYSNGDVVTLIGVAGMTQANLQFFRIAGVTQNTFELVNTDSSAWGTFTGTARVARCMPSMKVPRFVTAATQANPCVVTFSQPHGFANGQQIYLADLGGMVEIGTTAGSVFTVAGATSTTIQLSGVNSTSFGAYIGNGFAIEHVPLDQMQSWLWCENAPDVDTQSNQIEGVRIGICADPANSAGYDGKHIKNHFYNLSESGELFTSSLLGGDSTVVATQVDGPFRHAFLWKAANNKTVCCRINYDPNLPTLDVYATVHRIEPGASVIGIGDGYKAGANRLLNDVSGTQNFQWMGVTRVNVFGFGASSWLTANNPVGFGNAIFGAASVTTKSPFTRFVTVADSVTQTGDFYRKTSTGLIENVTFSSDVGGTEVVTCRVMANGNIQNTNNSYGAISDRRLKENILPARDYAADFAKLKFQRYSFKSEKADGPTQFGLIADEVASVFPGVVEETPVLDKDGNPTGETTSSVKYSIVNLIAAKVVQELTARVSVIEKKLGASKGAAR